jgi:hypothetical protein
MNESIPLWAAPVVLFASTSAADATTDLQSLLSETVVVGASKSAEKGSTGPAVTTNPTADDMRRYGIRTIDEAIDFLSLRSRSGHPHGDHRSHRGHPRPGVGALLRHAVPRPRRVLTPDDPGLLLAAPLFQCVANGPCGDICFQSDSTRSKSDRKRHRHSYPGIETHAMHSREASCAHVG